MVIRLKIPINAKNKKLNTKNPQVKHCICPKCVDLICTIYKPEKNC